MTTDPIATEPTRPEDLPRVQPDDWPNDLRERIAGDGNKDGSIRAKHLTFLKDELPWVVVDATDRRMSWGESFIGTGLGSCVDYGEHRDLTDDQLRAKVKEDKLKTREADAFTVECPECGVIAEDLDRMQAHHRVAKHRCGNGEAHDGTDSVKDGTIRVIMQQPFAFCIREGPIGSEKTYHLPDRVLIVRKDNGYTVTPHRD